MPSAPGTCSDSAAMVSDEQASRREAKAGSFRGLVQAVCAAVPSVASARCGVRVRHRAPDRRACRRRSPAVSCCNRGSDGVIVHVVPGRQLDNLQPQLRRPDAGGSPRRCRCSRRYRRTDARAPPSCPADNSRRHPPDQARRGRRPRQAAARRWTSNAVGNVGLSEFSTHSRSVARAPASPASRAAGSGQILARSGGISGEPSASTSPVPAARWPSNSASGPRGIGDVAGDRRLSRRQRRCSR